MVRILVACLVCIVLAAALTGRLAGAALPGEIRVVLSDSGETATIAGNISWSTADGRSGTSSDLAQLRLDGGQVSVDTHQFRAGSSRLVATPQSGCIRYSSREYRGRFEFLAGKGGGLVVLNVLPLEDYLLGVVPGEMPAGWPPEALRAQAVAARTYAVSRMMVNREASYDVYATVADQVYRGLDGEDPRTTAAVRETAGQIITYDGVPITAYYSADAGGYTRQGSLPYLQAVPTFDPESPHGDWQVELGVDRLSRIAEGLWQGTGRLTRIEAANDPVSGHLTSLMLIGEAGRVKLNPANLRKAIGYDVMKSTRARIYAAGAATAAPVVPQYAAAVPAVTIAPFPASAPSPLPGAITTGTLEINDFERPFIQSADASRDLKLRHMYAFNGRDLKQCDKLFVAADPGDVRAAQLAPVGEGVNADPVAPAAPAGPSAGFIPDAQYDETTIELDNGGIVIRGSGYGHGMGLSQWGARRLAADGWNYLDILQYFYAGVEIIGWSGEIPGLPQGDTSSFYEPFTQGR